MAYRIFRDSRGTEWQTWDVIPRREERRVSARRAAVTHLPGSDRRTRTDRRVVHSQRSVLTPGLMGGWLCFEAEVEKRRLSPIPSDWHHCPQERLERYCESATPARRMTRELRVIDMGERDRGT
ncbi:hypothetical protein BH11GEM1_BH11GEM1_22580 [soil metagenome]